MAASSSSETPQFINFLDEKSSSEEAETTLVRPAPTAKPRSDQAGTSRKGKQTSAPKITRAPRNRSEEPVVALTPEQLTDENQFYCNVCNKGFLRNQNLQLHLRGHDGSQWSLSKRDPNSRRKRYVCPVTKCVHHDPARALGDITGIKKHFSRKHCEKRFHCQTCNHAYAFYGDLKAHSKVCSKRTYSCSCGATFPKRDQLSAHKALCDAFTGNASVAHSQDPTFLSLSNQISPSVANPPNPITNSDALTKSLMPPFVVDSNYSEFGSSPMHVSSNAFIDKAKPSSSMNPSTFLENGDEIIKSAMFAPSLSTNSDAFLHKPMNAYTVNTSEGFLGSTIHAPSMNTSNGFHGSNIHAPSMNTSGPFQKSAMHPLPPYVAPMNLYGTSNNHTLFGASGNPSIDSYISEPLENDDISTNEDLMKTFGLSATHPMLAPSICSSMSSTMIYRPAEPQNAGTWKNKEALE